MLTGLNGKPISTSILGSRTVAKTSICPHLRAQYTEVFGLVQELKFHLEDIYCIELRKGFKRSSPESEPETTPHKLKRPRITNRPDPEMESEACIKQEYPFMDEAAKLYSRIGTHRGNRLLFRSGQRVQRQHQSGRRIHVIAVPGRRHHPRIATKMTRSIPDFALKRHLHLCGQACLRITTTTTTTTRPRC